MTTKRAAEKYFRRYLQMGPLSLALWRAVEAKHFSQILMKRPILDVGCGFGEFANAFVEKPFEVGVDISQKDLDVAQTTKKYKKLVCADAAKLPFKNNTFATVVSVSSLEHMKEPDKVFKEAYRVLKPGGKFVVTMETNEVDGNTFYRPFFTKIGLKELSDLCTRMYNSLFHRHTLLSKKVWIQKIKKAGFQIEVSKGIISPTITKLFDIFLITAWPSQVFRPSIGKRVVYRPKIASDILTKIFLPYVAEDEQEGTNLLVIAKKKR